MTGLGFQFQERLVPAGGYKPREDALDVFLVDAKLHAQKANNPSSFIRSYTKKSKAKVPGRAYGQGLRVNEGGSIEASFGFDEKELLKILEEQGKSMLRVYMPADGLPVYMAQDALERIQSIKKKFIKT